MKEKCTRWGKCRNKVYFSFGWLDSKGEWRSKHLTCRKHAKISAIQQEFECNMERTREEWRMRMERPRTLLFGTNP